MDEWRSAMARVQKSSSVDPVHILVGTDNVLRRWYVEQLERKMKASDEFGCDVYRYDYEEVGVGTAIQACQTLSLFSQTSLIVLDRCSLFLASQKGKPSTEDLEAYLSDPSTQHVLVIHVPGEKLDERKRISKLAKSHALVQCNTPKENEAIQILKAYVEQEDWFVDEDVWTELWRRTQSVSLAAMELDKLRMYDASGRITLKGVRELVAHPVEDNVFQWIDGVVKGDATASFRALTDLQHAGYDTFALYAMIGRQLRLMWYAKVLGEQGYSQQQIATRAGAHPFAVKVAAEQSRRMNRKRIERLMTVLADAEYAVKSGRRDPNHALDWVLLSCFQA